MARTFASIAKTIRKQFEGRESDPVAMRTMEAKMNKLMQENEVVRADKEDAENRMAEIGMRFGGKLTYEKGGKIKVDPEIRAELLGEAQAAGMGMQSYIKEMDNVLSLRHGGVIHQGGTLAKRYANGGRMSYANGGETGPIETEEQAYAAIVAFLGQGMADQIASTGGLANFVGASEMDLYNQLTPIAQEMKAQTNFENGTGPNYGHMPPLPPSGVFDPQMEHAYRGEQMPMRPGEVPNEVAQQGIQSDPTNRRIPAWEADYAQRIGQEEQALAIQQQQQYIAEQQRLQQIREDRGDVRSTITYPDRPSGPSAIDKITGIVNQPGNQLPPAPQTQQPQGALTPEEQATVNKINQERGNVVANDYPTAQGPGTSAGVVTPNNNTPAINDGPPMEDGTMVYNTGAGTNTGGASGDSGLKDIKREDDFKRINQGALASSLPYFADIVGSYKPNETMYDKPTLDRMNLHRQHTEAYHW